MEIEKIIELLKERESLSVNEVFPLLREIRHLCPDLNFKIITVEDIVDFNFDSSNWSDEDLERAKNIARDSWELKNWTYMGEFEWQYFIYVFPKNFIDEMTGKYPPEEE